MSRSERAFLAMVSLALASACSGANGARGSDQDPSGSCERTTCAAQNKNCGTISDGCGGLLACGTCATGSCGGGGFDNVCGKEGGAISEAAPLELSAQVVPEGGTLTATAVFANRGSTAVEIQAIVIKAVHVESEKAIEFEPTLGRTTFYVGDPVQLAATHLFGPEDPAGDYRAFATYQDAEGAWHDGERVSFSVGICTPEDQATFCARLGASCGEVSGTDNCGAARTVRSCGECEAPETCGGAGVPFECGEGECQPESDDVFCGRVGTPCETTTAPDNCGATRTVDCGGTCGSDVLPADRRTTWSAGIPGGIPSNVVVHTTIDAGRYGTGAAGAPDAQDAIQDAIDAAAGAYTAGGPIQAVVLPAGVYKVGSQLDLSRSGVVLRGEGPERTKVRFDTNQEWIATFFLGRGSNWPQGVIPLARDAPKGSREIIVSDAHASKFEVGDVLQIDQRDEDYVFRRRNDNFKRQSGSSSWYGPPNGGAFRSMGSQIRVVSKDVSGGEVRLGLGEPLHRAFKTSQAAEVFHTGTPRIEGTQYVGVEDLYVTGGGNNQWRFMVVNAAYCWIRNVHSDGSPTASVPGSYGSPTGFHGRHVEMAHAYRCEIRDSYIHHSRDISFGGQAYGLFLTTQSSANLFENNIVLHLNKPVIQGASGGGNVWSYNYVDNAYIDHIPGAQESSISGNHQSFSHSDLFEGNWVANLTSDSYHGNSGWHVFFRNHATGSNGSPPAPDRTTMRAVHVDPYSRFHTFVGNVLMVPAIGPSGCPVLQAAVDGRADCPAIWLVGNPSNEDGGAALAQLHRHGNWDSITGGVTWEDGNPVRTLPNSLYRTSKPAFFGGHDWPWVDPLAGTLEDRVKVLPAKARYDAGKPNG